MSKKWERRVFPDPLTDAIFAFCVDVAAPSKFLPGTSNFCGNLADYLREHGFAVPAARPQPKGGLHRAPDFVDEHGLPRFVCECGTVVGLHEFGRHDDCECEAPSKKPDGVCENCGRPCQCGTSKPCPVPSHQ